MKESRLMIALLCTLVIAVALPAGAQSQSSGARQSDNVNALSLEEGLLGKDVKTDNGENVGEVEDVIFTRQGRISHFLMSVDEGFLGLGGKTVAVSPNRIRFGEARDHLLFNGTENELQNMPEVDIWAYRPSSRGYYGPDWGPYGDPYGYRPYYGYGPNRGYGPGAYPPTEGRWQEERRFQQDQGSRQQPPRRGYDQDPRQGRAEMRQGAQQGQMQRGMNRGISGDFFLGAPVFNQWNDSVGSIEDLVIDPSNGRITHAVLEVGGVLGIGDKEVVVPFNQLKHVGPYTVLYRGTQDQLEQMPAYQKGEGGQVIGLGRQEQRAGGQGSGQSKDLQGQGRSQQQQSRQQ